MDGPRGISHVSTGKVVGGLRKPKAVAIAKPSVKFCAQSEVFAAEIAGIRAGLESERTTRSQSVAKFPGEGAEILLGDEILRDIPAFEIAGENELEFRSCSFSARCCGKLSPL